MGDARLDEMQPVQAAYTTDNWRAFRAWGLSGNSPWEHDRFWKLRDGFQPRRQDLPVDWDNLQQPGYSPDFIDRTYARFDMAYQRSDWVASPTAESLLRNNMPLLGWIAGKPEHFTTKDHIFYPGETVEKQLIVINNSRLTVTCDASWSADLGAAVGGAKQVVIPTGDQARVPVQLKLPADLAPGNYQITASFKFSTGESQEDSFTLQVIPRSAPPRPVSKIALFDPPGQTTKLLAGLGVTCQAGGRRRGPFGLRRAADRQRRPDCGRPRARSQAGARRAEGGRVRANRRGAREAARLQGRGIRPAAGLAARAGQPAAGRPQQPKTCATGAALPLCCLPPWPIR